MWRRTANGRTFTFHLAGINNQNFIMRDDETGSYWQQITGRAISGPLKGAALELVSTDELAFRLWQKEAPEGRVLMSSAESAKEYDKDWEKSEKNLPTVVKFSDNKLPLKEVVIGISLNGEDRAYPLAKIAAAGVIVDKLGGVPIIVVAAEDGKSIRAFRSEGQEFFRKSGKDWALLDNAGGEWDFRGCNQEGQCLEPVGGLKDFWFDWRLYHPNTGIYQH